MCSGDVTDHPDPAGRHRLQTTALLWSPHAIDAREAAVLHRFGNGDAPPAAGRPLPSPPCSVYRALRIVPTIPGTPAHLEFDEAHQVRENRGTGGGLSWKSTALTKRDLP